MIRQAVLLAIVSLALPAGVGAADAGRQDPPASVEQDAPPRILLDASPRAVEYQLARLTDAELARVERRDDDPRYVPVYQALLRRPGLAPALGDEALAALVTLEATTPVRVLLAAIARTSEAAEATPLVRRLAAQSPEALAADVAHAATLVETSAAGAPLARAAWLVLVAGGRDPGEVLAMAEAAGQRLALYDALSVMRASAARDRAAEALGSHLGERVAAAGDAAERAAAIRALAVLAPEPATVGALADVAASAPDAVVMAAVVEAVEGIPDAERMGDGVGRLTRALVAWVGRVDAAARTDPPAVDAMALAERLAAALPPPEAAAVRADLRTLGVRVVRLEALVEQVAFDRRWFVVEAGRPVQVVFFNPDAMPHNVVIGQPGSLEAIGTAGGAMSFPDDPSIRPFVPDLPEVIAATDLINQDETARLSFTAPETPGEYVFVCTFPGHWVRMYGVMLVVDDLGVWEANPTMPSDPMTGQVFE